MKLKINCKLFLLHLLQLVICSSICGQGVTVGVTIGANIEVSLGSSILSVTGDWDNSGTFNAENGTVVFNGPTGNQSITNAQGETFKNLTVDKAGGDVLLQNNIQVNGTLQITSGDLDLNGKIITLGASADLSESDGATVKGTSGYIKTARDLNNPNNLNVAGMGIVLTTPANLGNTEIRRGHSDQACNGGTSILRYFEITPANNAGLNASLTFVYDDSEINGLNEAGLQLLRYDGVGVWYNHGGTVNTTNNTVSIAGIDEFSKWTLSSNRTPELANIEGVALGYTEGNSSVAITQQISVTDVDDINIESAVVQITGNYQNGEDNFEFAGTANITGTWDGNNGKLTMTGSDTKANYQTALKSVKYLNTSDNPVTSIQDGKEVKVTRVITATPRTVSFTVNDGSSNSNTVTRDINITAVNDAPIIAVNSALVVDEGAEGIIDGTNLQAEDIDGASLSIRYYVQQAPQHGTLSKTAFTQNELNINGITYTHNGDNSETDEFKFTLVDVEGGTSPEYTFGITINQIPNPPLPPSGLQITFNQNGNPVLTWVLNGGNIQGINVWRNANQNAKLDQINEYELIATLPGDAVTYTDETAEEGISYSYQIESFNEDGSSGFESGSVLIPPKTPSDLMASSNEDGTITITWNDNSSIEEGYKVERKTGEAGLYGVIANVVSNSQSYTDADVVSNQTYYYCIKAYTSSCESGYSNECCATSIITGIYEWLTGIPTEFTLRQNFPNPFNPSTTIIYGLPEASDVKLVIYNMLGQEVAALVSETQSAGYHSVTFEANGINSGIYLYKITAGNYSETKKCILIK